MSGPAEANHFSFPIVPMERWVECRERYHCSISWLAIGVGKE